MASLAIRPTVRAAQLEGRPGAVVEFDIGNDLRGVLGSAYRPGWREGVGEVAGRTIRRPIPQVVSRLGGEEARVDIVVASGAGGRGPAVLDRFPGHRSHVTSPAFKRAVGAEQGEPEGSVQVRVDPGWPEAVGPVAVEATPLGPPVPLELTTVGILMASRTLRGDPAREPRFELRVHTFRGPMASTALQLPVGPLEVEARVGVEPPTGDGVRLPEGVHRIVAGKATAIEIRPQGGLNRRHESIAVGGRVTVHAGRGEG